MPDAQLVALALEHAAEIVSFDRDFARFSDLRWSIPGPVQSPPDPVRRRAGG